MWKTYWGRCIHQSPSGLSVHQNAWYRWLSLSDGFIQTCLHRHHRERSGLEYITPLKQMVAAYPGDCILLGLGGAGILHALSKPLLTQSVIAVDNNAEVISIAAQYFYTDQLKQLRIIHQNATDFITSTTKTVQHVIIDLCTTEDYPEECNTDIFFSCVQKCLIPEGILSINVINLYNKQALFDRIKRQFHHCTLVVPVKNTSNTLIFAYNQLTFDAFIKKIAYLYPLKQVVWDSVWGAVVTA